MGKIVIINSHPIQYFAPLYRFLTQKGMNVEVWYCSDESIKGHFDEGFNQKVKWDVDLLDGYKSRFFSNRKNGSIHSGFFGLVNFRLLKELMVQPRGTVVWIHGWAYFTQVSAVFLSKITGKKVWIRAENPLNQELKKVGLRPKLLFAFRKYLFFPLIDRFLYIGDQNKNLFKHYGISSNKLIFTPYAVDNARFRKDYSLYSPKTADLKFSLNLPIDKKIILFSAKYIPKKRPLDLIIAFEKLQKDNNVHLVMLGEGVLRKEMEQYIKAKNLQNITLTGFINQSEISKYYTIADVFVMCSEIGETWGLSVNEAMNFNLPVVVSDMCGSAHDLVTAQNGIMYKTGDVQALSQAIKYCLQTFNKQSCTSQRVVETFSYDTIHLELEKNLDWI